MRGKERKIGREREREGERGRERERESQRDATEAKEMKRKKAHNIVRNNIMGVEGGAYVLLQLGTSVARIGEQSRTQVGAGCEGVRHVQISDLPHSTSQQRNTSVDTLGPLVSCDHIHQSVR